MEDKIYVLGPLRVVPYKVLIALRPLLFCVTCEHALKADAYALYVMYG